MAFLRTVKAWGGKGIQHQYVRLVDIDLGHGSVKRSVTRGSQRAARILATVDIEDRKPPPPSRSPRTRRSDNPRNRLQ